LDEIPGIPVSKQIHSALDHARCAIQAKGGTIQKMDPYLFKKSAPIWFATLIENAHRGPSFKSILGNGPEINPLMELIQFPMGLGRHTFPCLMLALMETLSDFVFSKKYKRQLYEEGLELKNKLNKILGPNGVLICPVYPTPAPKHHIPKLRPFAWIYSGIFNVLELPATAFPVEYSEITGRAYSIQAVAAHGMDHLTLQTAELLECGPRILSSWTE
jgi:fatty acid amide hydrolase 2